MHNRVLPSLKVLKKMPIKIHFHKKVLKGVPKKGFHKNSHQKKCSIECQKRGSQKLKKKVQKMWLRKVHKKSFATFKSYENSANKVLFPKKVLKRVPKKRVPKKVQEKVQKMGLKSAKKSSITF